MHNNMDHNVVISVASIVLNALWLEDAYEPVVLAALQLVIPTNDGPLDACIVACNELLTHGFDVVDCTIHERLSETATLPSSSKIHLLRSAVGI